MEPNISRMPAPCVAAGSMAKTIRCASRLASLPMATAALKSPQVPVLCRPTS